MALKIIAGQSPDCASLGNADLPHQIPTLTEAISRAKNQLCQEQMADGHWIYELEADCSIPAEYILMTHFVNEIDVELEGKIARYLRTKQDVHDGWSLYPGGDFDISCSVKAYYALKLAGDDINSPHMSRARTAILNHGGAAHCNVFTRITLALFEQVPWRATPFIPAEIILLPKWFPFHISKVAYWSRTVMVPLFVLCTMKPKAVNPRSVDIRELFIRPPEEEEHYFHAGTKLHKLFLLLDNLGRAIERIVPKFVRQISISKCERWFLARMNGTHGIGGIFPAMVNVYECLVTLGYAKDHPQCQQARQAIDNLLMPRDDGVYCQPCVSPIWDTALSCQALIETEQDAENPAVQQSIDWLLKRQLLDEPGDWRKARPKLAGGGWAFQYSNYYYPDLDDTSMVAWAIHRVGAERYAASLRLAAEWVAGMQSKGGGFGSFELDNTHYYLNAIPFADHGALLDPPTADVTGRAVALLCLVDKTKYASHINDAITYLKEEQEDDGSWFGRWGTNYIYGTWSVLSALELTNEDPQEDYIQSAIKWLIDNQNSDGGWGESNDNYYPPKHLRPHYSTSFQTAWALLALLAVENPQHLAIKRGIDYLLKTQQDDGFWYEADYTAPGFPRVFYLKYHGYTKYFPLWALARYRNLSAQAC